MLPICFRTNPNIPLIEATACYVRADYKLLVLADKKTQSQIHRISIDTLTLLFDPEYHIFIGIDAYTNFERWGQQLLSMPSSMEQATLVCTNTFDEHGIGKGSSDIVRYNFCEKTNVLLIKISDSQVAHQIRCLSCVTFGIGIHGDLIEIWVSGLVFK